MVVISNDGKSTIWKYGKGEWESMVNKSKELKTPFFIGYRPKLYFKEGETK